MPEIAGKKRRLTKQMRITRTSASRCVGRSSSAGEAGRDHRVGAVALAADSSTQTSLPKPIVLERRAARRDVHVALAERQVDVARRASCPRSRPCRSGRRIRATASAGSRSPVTRQWPVSSASFRPGMASGAPKSSSGLDQHAGLRLQRGDDAQPSAAQAATCAQPVRAASRRGLAAVDAGLRHAGPERHRLGRRHRADLERPLEEVDPARAARRRRR